MTNVPPVKAGDPISAKSYNEIAKRSNDYANANLKPPSWRQLALYRITSDFTTRQTNSVDDDVKSCDGVELMLIVNDNAYKPLSDPRSVTLYRTAAGADLTEGDNCWANFNEQSGRWEIVSGGPPEPGSSSSEVCRQGLGGIPYSAMPGYVEGVAQFPYKTANGCTALVTPKQCSTPSSSSSSPSSSSSSEEANIDCDECSGGTPATITINVAPYSAYGLPPREFGSDDPIVLNQVGGEPCFYLVDLPLLAGPEGGVQRWAAIRDGSGWTLTLTDTTGEPTYPQPAVRYLITGGDCCGEKTFLRDPSSNLYGPETISANFDCP